MRIAIVALSCNNGGMLHYASQLANALAARAEVHFFSPLKPELREYLGPNVQLHGTRRLSFAGEMHRTLAAQLNPMSHMENARLIRSVRPDVVHVVTNHPSNCLLLPLLRGIPRVFTHHDPSQHPGEVARFKDLLTKLSVREYEALVAHGEALKAELLGQGIDASRIAVISHGDFGFMRRLAPEVTDQPMILFFGRLVSYKGLEVLCRAERLLRDRLGDYEVVIAGEGDEGLFAADLDPTGRVRVINKFLSDQEAAELFARARVVVLPYTQASQSGVLAIAFAFGKPAIVTDVGGLPEAVGHGAAGLIVPPDDAPALSDAIARLWHDPALRSQLAQAGYERVEREIGWPHVAERHLSLYRDLVTTRAAALSWAPGAR